MGCGCSVPVPISDEQKATIYEKGAKQMMKRCLVYGYKHKADIKVKAPTEELAQVRHFHEKLQEWEKSIADKVDDAKDGLNAKIDKGADKIGDAAGKLGGNMFGAMVGAVAGGAATVATAGAEAASAVSGFAAEMALKGFAGALGTAINAIDKPFEDVANDIFEAKKVEIVKMYCKIIGDDVKIDGAIKLVRGDPPHDQAKEGKVGDTKSGSACVLLMQQNVTVKMQTELHKVVQEEINKHAVTKACDVLVETYNKIIKEVGEIEALKKIVGGELKLDINTYIVNQCIIEFFALMAKREVEIRTNESLKKEEGGLSEMPKIFHLVFSGFQDWTLAHYTDMNGEFEKLAKWMFQPQGLDNFPYDEK